jgi:hypothetical protein
MQAVHAFFGAAHTALSSRVPYIPSVSWLEAIVTVQLVLLVAFPLAKYLYQGLCGGRWSGRKYVRAGEWALVTGGSDGIGKAYAKELMAKGMNVLILARTRANLEEACKELREGYSGSAVVDFHVADFSKPAVYPGIAASAWECARTSGLPACPLLSLTLSRCHATPHTCACLRAGNAQGPHLPAHQQCGRVLPQPLVLFRAGCVPRLSACARYPLLLLLAHPPPHTHTAQPP